MRWDSDYGQIELEANIFAANLLMPLDDFRLQIDDRDRPALIELSMCADRYCVSLIAAILRWLEYTRRRACLVLSRDGFVLWARSSKHALRTGIFIKTVDRPPVAIPDLSLASRRDCIECGAGTTWHESGVWFEEECEELVLFSDQYDFTISLLHLSDAVVGHELNEEQEEDTVDLFSRLLHR